MTKILGLVVMLFAATVVNANQSVLIGEHSVFTLNESSCVAGDVLNCSGGPDGHHIYEKEAECPVGGEKFKARYLGTHSTYGRHLDWEPVSYMRFPVPLPVCPTNGFVITEEKYAKEELDKLKAIVESKTYKDLYAQKHATFFLFAKLKELNKEKFDDYWWLYLNATWEADNCKDKVRYKEYALEAISAGTKRLAELKDSEDLYWVLKVVTADLHRRIGDFKTSQELADKFGTPTLADKDSNEFFLLAKKLLLKAIREKNTDRVAIKDARDDIK